MYLDNAINNIQRICIDYNNGKKSVEQTWSEIVNVVLHFIKIQMKGDV